MELLEFKGFKVILEFKEVKVILESNSDDELNKAGMGEHCGEDAPELVGLGGDIDKERVACKGFAGNHAAIQGKTIDLGTELQLSMINTILIDALFLCNQGAGASEASTARAQHNVG